MSFYISVNVPFQRYEELGDDVQYSKQTTTPPPFPWEGRCSLSSVIIGFLGRIEERNFDATMTKSRDEEWLS